MIFIFPWNYDIYTKWGTWKFLSSDLENLEKSGNLISANEWEPFVSEPFSSHLKFTLYIYI